MFQSGGVLLKGSPTTLWTGSPATWGYQSGSSSSWHLAGLWAGYGELYRKQHWVRVCVDKLAWMHARLPLKVYERDELNRPEAREHPYARLLRRPNDRHSAFFFWTWVSSTFDIYGEVFLGKVRDAGGRPIALVPMHPLAMFEDGTDSNGATLWRFQNGTVQVDGIRSEDLVHIHNYNPDTLSRGLSKLESLRATLENEANALNAQSSFWRNGARPGYILTHPGNVSADAGGRLKLQWNTIASGSDNHGTTVILEEGMKAEKVTLSADEAQYIQGRKLNREEVVAAFDMPPPAVHILDHATYSNITEQLRSVYRDTMAPRCNFFEAELETQLRGARRAGASETDFGDEIYAEFLLDEVLRGDFETRTEAWVKSITHGGATIAEWRKAENRPYIAGTERLHINSAAIALPTGDEDFTKDDALKVDAAAALIRAGFEPESAASYVGLPPIPHTGLVPVTVKPEEAMVPTQVVRSVMGRLSRASSLSDVDVAALTEGLGEHAPAVRSAFDAALAANESVPELRARMKALAAKEAA